MIGKRFRSLPFIFANDNYTLSSPPPNRQTDANRRISRHTAPKAARAFCTADGFSLYIILLFFFS